MSGLALPRRITEPFTKDRSVIFLQDVARIENQAQQLKLASMGRLTASIAHEVRNPLAAIAHASALLIEDANSPAQQRLLNIVSDNVARMNRGGGRHLKSLTQGSGTEFVILRDFVAELKSSFEDIHGLSNETIELAELDGYKVRFDPLHLQRSLVEPVNQRHALCQRPTGQHPYSCRSSDLQTSGTARAR